MGLVCAVVGLFSPLATVPDVGKSLAGCPMLQLLVAIVRRLRLEGEKLEKGHPPPEGPPYSLGLSGRGAALAS